MKISLAANFDDNLIEQIKDYPVYEIYGKLKYDFIGGGRPDNTLADIDKIKFEKHVKKVRDAGIRFNYLLNGSCLTNIEQDKNWQKEFKVFLSYLKSVGVNALTVTNPFLLMFIKKHFKDDFKIRISTFACVDSYAKAKYWEDIGADYICADFTKINRDFKTLKYIVKNLKKAKLEILVTNSCLKNCPILFAHTNALSHASTKNNNAEKYEDWSLFYCQKRQLENVDEYIKSPWVRPEDIKYYEQIGIEHFKITERGFPTEELLKRLKAYTTRSYDGNLLDLIQGHGVETENKFEVKEKTLNDRRKIYDEIKKVRGLGTKRTWERHIYIDNKKLDKFIDFFLNGNCSGNCSSCNYCTQIAQKVIRKNEDTCNYLKKLYDKYDELKLDAED